MDPRIVEAVQSANEVFRARPYYPRKSTWDVRKAKKTMIQLAEAWGIDRFIEQAAEVVLKVSEKNTGIREPVLDDHDAWKSIRGGTTPTTDQQDRASSSGAQDTNSDTSTTNRGSHESPDVPITPGTSNQLNLGPVVTLPSDSLTSSDQQPTAIDIHDQITLIDLDLEGAETFYPEFAALTEIDTTPEPRTPTYSRPQTPFETNGLACSTPKGLSRSPKRTHRNNEELRNLLCLSVDDDLSDLDISGLEELENIRFSHGNSTDLVLQETATIKIPSTSTSRKRKPFSDITNIVPHTMEKRVCLVQLEKLSPRQIKKLTKRGEQNPGITEDRTLAPNKQPDLRQTTQMDHELPQASPGPSTLPTPRTEQPNSTDSQGPSSTARKFDLDELFAEIVKNCEETFSVNNKLSYLKDT